MKKRLTRRLVLLVSLALVIFLNLFFLFSNFSLKLPPALLAELENQNITLKSNKVQTKILPYPHLLLSGLKVKADERATLTIARAEFHFDLLKLAFSRTQVLESVRLSNVKLHWLIRQRPEQTGLERLKNVVAGIETGITAIPQALTNIETIQVDRFELFYDRISKEDAILTATDLRVENEAKTAKKINLAMDVVMGAWLRSRVHIHIWSQNNLVNQVDIYVNSGLTLENLADTFEDTGGIAGEIMVSNFLSFTLPLKQITHSHFIHISNLKYGPLSIIPEQNTRISFSGTANEQQVITDDFEINLGPAVFKARGRWLLKKFNLVFQFQQNKVLSAHLQKSLSTGRLKAAFSRRSSYIVPEILSWYPWRDRNQFIYRFKSHLAVLPREKLKQSPHLMGTIVGKDQLWRSNNIALIGAKTYLPLKGFKLNLANRQLFTRLNGSFYLEDFLSSSRGGIYLAGKVNCRFNKRLNCHKNYVYAKSRRSFVTAGAAARFYRLLSINLFSYWRSLKPDSEIEVKNSTAQGYLVNNYLDIKTSSIKSDVGNLEFTGKWKLLEGDGKFTLRMSPLNVDKVLAPIPLVGKALNNSISFAAQMIFSLNMNENKMKLQSFTLGKGVESLKKAIEN